MPLKKVIKEKYSLKKHFPNCNDAPRTKILEDLKPYSSPPTYSNDNARNIPSILGGVVYVIETISANKPGIQDTKVFFHYLEGADKEDLNFIRNIICKKGLERKSLNNPTMYDVI